LFKSNAKFTGEKISMNRKVILLGAAICLLASACSAGAPPAPTLDPINIVNTAQAAAFTVIAETQAAIPTATPLPPTEIPTQTPLPTDTPLALPTIAPTSISILPTATTSNTVTGGDPCYHPIDPDTQGIRSVIRIKNKTKGLISVFVYLYQKNVFGDCGYIGFDLSKGDSSTITTMPVGYYAVTAWTNNRTKTAYGTAIISDNHLIDFEVYDDWIQVIYP
jgi:hypothetical protein